MRASAIFCQSQSVPDVVSDVVSGVVFCMKLIFNCVFSILFSPFVLFCINWARPLFCFVLILISVNIHSFVLFSPFLVNKTLTASLQNYYTTNLITTEALMVYGN